MQILSCTSHISRAQQPHVASAAVLVQIENISTMAEKIYYNSVPQSSNLWNCWNPYPGVTDENSFVQSCPNVPHH